jgi:peptidoglycan/LPS O-acetylase OafA/YrhL
MTSTPSIKVSGQDAENPGGFSHLPALDGVRGLAILLVLTNHIFFWNSHTGRWFLDVLAEMRGCTWMGVNLFFALSGFLITGILMDTLAIPHFFKTFYARRALRIFPLYYGALVVLLLLTRPLHLSWGGWQIFYLTYTANLALWWDKPLLLSHFRIVHFWSLQVEEQFYLLWPLVVYWVKKPARLIRFSLIACVVVFLVRILIVVMRVRSTPYIYMPNTATFCCCDNLLYGCALALLVRTRWRDKVLSWAPLLFVACVVPIAIERLMHLGMSWANTFFMPTFGFSLIGIGSASLVAMALRTGSFVQRVFTLSVLRFFGRYSYGLYVFHYSVEGFLGAPLYALFLARLHVRAISGLLSGGVVFGLSVVLAMLSYHLYEVHFLKLKKYFSYSGSAKRLQTSAVETVGLG